MDEPFIVLVTVSHRFDLAFRLGHRTIFLLEFFHPSSGYGTELQMKFLVSRLNHFPVSFYIILLHLEDKYSQDMSRM